MPGWKARPRTTEWRRSHQYRPVHGTAGAVDAGLLAGADPQRHPVAQVAHRVGLGVAQDRQTEHEICHVCCWQLPAHDHIEQGQQAGVASSRLAGGDEALTSDPGQQFG